MRVAIRKSTGKLIEAQSGDDPGRLQTLINNAVAAGISPDDIDAKVVSEEAFQLLINPPPTLDELKTSKVRALKDAVNAFIEKKPDGWTRYDVNLKLNMLSLAVTTGKPGDKALEAYAWLQNMQKVYYERKAEIDAIRDLLDEKGGVISGTGVKALGEIDISYGWFEERYGVDGKVYPDPDVYTKDL